MLRVFICSPLSAPTADGIARNIQLAQDLAYAAMKLEDVAAFCPHGFYTAFLDDTDPDERELGLLAGKSWLDVADEIWVFSKYGITKGMAQEIERASADKTVVRFDPSCWDTIGAN